MYNTGNTRNNIVFRKVGTFLDKSMMLLFLTFPGKSFGYAADRLFKVSKTLLAPSGFR